MIRVSGIGVLAPRRTGSDGSGLSAARPAESLPRPERWLGPPPRLGRMDRFCQLALLAANQALLDAGFDHAAPADPAGDADPAGHADSGGALVDGSRCGVFVGTSFGSYATNETYYRALLEGGPGAASPRLFAYTLPSCPAGEIAIQFGLRGPTLTVAQGLEAPLVAWRQACEFLRRRRADLLLVVGVDAPAPAVIELEQEAGLCGPAAPASEAAAALVLETSESANRRRAASRLRPLGLGSGQGEAALAVAARQALDQAELSASDMAAVIDAAASGPLCAAYQAAHAELALGGENLDCAALFGQTFGAAAAIGLCEAARLGLGPVLVWSLDPGGSAAAAIVDARGGDHHA